jgi:hypothetical protein
MIWFPTPYDTMSDVDVRMLCCGGYTVIGPTNY